MQSHPSKPHRYRALISYIGTKYCGWQSQSPTPELLPSLQNTIQAALSRHFDEPMSISASGRTDAGVHALGQVVSFQSNHSREPYSVLRAMNSLLPTDIRFLRVHPADPEFHPRFSASKKTYVYRLGLGKALPAHWESRALLWSAPLDLRLLESAMKALEGEYDFACFQATGSSVKDTVRTLFRVQSFNTVCFSPWDEILELEFTGSGFLKQMVRSLVGTLLEIANGKISLETLKECLHPQDEAHQRLLRAKIGATVPPDGLYLKSVEYPNLTW